MESSRRNFLKSAALSAAANAAAPRLSFGGKKAAGAKGPEVMVSKGGSPAENTRKAIEALGGIDKFVKPGDRVFLKPNSISSTGPETAVNTNPEVALEVARLCRKAGAKEILALMHDDESVLKLNGIGDAIESVGGRAGSANDMSQYIEVNLPRGLILRKTMVIKELLEFDKFINIPVAKHHAGSQLTFGMKNLMGLNWDRIIMHRTDLEQAIADLATVRPPDLVVIDATRILLTNGPGGPGAVRETRTIVASADQLAADAYTATLFKLNPYDVRHFRYAYDMGIGEIDPKRMKIQEFTFN